MSSCVRSFFDHSDRQLLAALCFLHLREAQRRSKSGWTRADNQDINFKSLALGHALLLQLRDDRRRELEEITLDAVIGDLEDRRVRVLVNRHDRARSLHANEMLNRTRNAEGHV